jgi:hypothetical protein
MLKNRHSSIRSTAEVDQGSARVGNAEVWKNVEQNGSDDYHCLRPCSSELRS